jgi:hypothetical protein
MSHESIKRYLETHPRSYQTSEMIPYVALNAQINPSDKRVLCADPNDKSWFNPNADIHISSECTADMTTDLHASLTKNLSDSHASEILAREKIVR